MELMFIGADHEVTGSCHYLRVGEKNILVDYGMEQGIKVFENCELPVDAALIDYVFLTHAHIDHSGLLPLLYARGFRGSIYATEATCDLCSIMLRDCAHIHMQEAEYLAQLEGLYPPETQPAADPVQEKADEIDDNVQRLLAQAMEAATAENLRSRAAAAEDRDLSDTAEFAPGQPIEEEEDFPPVDDDDYEDEDDDPRRRPPTGSRINFGELQFGQDYEIT